MSNIFGVYDADEELQGMISTDNEGNITEMANIDVTGHVDVVAKFDESGNAESVWTNNIFGGTNEYTPEGELSSYSVPDPMIEGVEHVFDADGELNSIDMTSELADSLEPDLVSGDSESIFGSFDMDGLV
ncbi:hypothetical protein [Vibrio cortegadensis]|uniref:Uncharacterized protein n=1 Tax=Vibrio cortegadensis TaxID=1328770 RepID=A0ABV4M9P9_9VIBR